MAFAYKNIIMSKLLVIILLIFFLGAVAAVLGYSSYQSSLTSELPISEDVKFTVTPGSSVEKIISDLEEQNIIQNTQVFSVYLKLNPEAAKNFKAGEFTIKKGSTLKTLAETLQDASADRNDMAVLIQEGLRYDEIADILEKSFSEVSGSKFSRSEYIAIVESPAQYNFSPAVSEFLSDNKPAGKNLEGFLYPETYFFPKDAAALDVINIQINTLSQKLTQEDKNQVQKTKYSFYEYLTIASMIEREAFADSEKPDIADVIFKRLENGVLGVKLLQIDATLLYQAKDWKADPVREKSKDGPYNTYTRTGLPPTPISNPGIDSLRAALYPNSNDYYFYLHDADGVIHFARNQSEHNANVRRYILN